MVRRPNDWARLTRAASPAPRKNPPARWLASAPAVRGRGSFHSTAARPGRSAPVGQPMQGNSRPINAGSGWRCCPAGQRPSRPASSGRGGGAVGQGTPITETALRFEAAHRNQAGHPMEAPKPANAQPGDPSFLRHGPPPRETPGLPARRPGNPNRPNRPATHRRPRTAGCGFRMRRASGQCLRCVAAVVQGATG